MHLPHGGCSEPKSRRPRSDDRLDRFDDGRGEQRFHLFGGPAAVEHFEQEFDGLFGAAPRLGQQESLSRRAGLVTGEALSGICARRGRVVVRTETSRERTPTTVGTAEWWARRCVPIARSGALHAVAFDRWFERGSGNEKGARAGFVWCVHFWPLC